MKLKKILVLTSFVLITEGVGVLGGLFTAPAVSSQWYSDLAKPFLQPPAWIFAPVWTTLYLLMGIAAFLVWDSGKRRGDVQKALRVFGVQLLLNLTWSILFFGLYSIGGALVDIIFLWIAIVVTIYLFSKISKPAAWLLVPYILWVSFASYLNFAIFMLN